MNMYQFDENARPDKVFVHLKDNTPFAERNAWTAAFLHVAITHMNNYGGKPDVIAMAVRTFARAYTDTTEENEKIVYDALMKKLYESEPVVAPDNKNFYRRQIAAMEKIIAERGLLNLYDMRVYEACQALLYPESTSLPILPWTSRGLEPESPDSSMDFTRLEPDKNYAD